MRAHLPLVTGLEPGLSLCADVPHMMAHRDTHAFSALVLPGGQGSGVQYPADRSVGSQASAHVLSTSCSAITVPYTLGCLYVMDAAYVLCNMLLIHAANTEPNQSSQHIFPPCYYLLRSLAVN
jgi:hypothetical protein